MANLASHQREWTVRRIVAELPFIPATSNWLKLLLSLLAEPLMFVSSLYIIAETVIPDAAVWPSILTNGTKMVMSLAPEIILPGCFQQAQLARRNSNSIKGNLLLCLCALFGLLTLVTLASFIWHFSGPIDDLILFIRCGAGISYTIILNISGQDEPVISPPQSPLSSPQDDQIDRLTETVNTLTAQLTTILSVTQNNNFLISPLQDVLPASSPLLPSDTPHPISMREATLPLFHTKIQPLRVNTSHGDAGLHLLALVTQQTETASNTQENEAPKEIILGEEEEHSARVYPVVAGVSPQKVKQLIDAFLSGTKWRDLPGHYSQTIKPVREAWERLHTRAE
jgi:hypothetical protein